MWTAKRASIRSYERAPFFCLQSKAGGCAAIVSRLIALLPEDVVEFALGVVGETFGQGLFFRVFLVGLREDFA